MWKENDAINAPFIKILDTSDNGDVFDKIAEFLRLIFKKPKFLLLSRSNEGKFNKNVKRGFYMIPPFNIPITFVKDFDDLKNDYDFVCIAIKKEKIVEQ